MPATAPRNAFILSLTGSRWTPAAALTLSACLTSNAAAQTTVAGGTTVPDTVANLNAAGDLNFTTGDSTPGTLEVTTSGTFTNSWTINDAIARFVLNGNTFTINSSAPAGNVATGDTAIRVENGTLVLASNSFLAGFTGSLRASNNGTIQIQQADWLTSATGITLDGTAGSATLAWDNAAAVTYAGALTLVGGNDVTVRALQESGALTLTGAVAGTGNLRVLHTGATAGPTVILGLTGGFTGRTILDTANVRINTQESIGSAGLTLNSATLTAGTNLTIGAAQSLVVGASSTITSVGGTRTLTIDGLMDGGANLTLDNAGLVVSAGATSTYTGALSLRGGSSLTVANQAWLTAVGAVNMNADGNASTFTYSGAAAGTFDGTLNTGTGGTATVSSTGQNFELTGTVGGAGNLLVTRTAATTAEITLGFTAGSFTGRTIVSSTAARLTTDRSIGTAGLTLAGGDLTVDTGAPLTLLAAQTLAVTGTSSLTGTGGSNSLVLDGTMSGDGTLTLSGIAMTVNNTTSAFTGGVTLGAGSALTVANGAWMNSLGALTFNNAVNVDYTGATAATFDGALTLAADASFRTSGAAAAALTLGGAVSGTGNLTLSAVGGSTAGFTLGLTGSFDGSTIVNDVDVTINTQGSVGQDGLQLNDGGGAALAATIGGNLALGAAQSLTLAGTVNMTGATDGLSVDAQGGLLSGAAATLNLSNVALTVGDGAASTYTGAISLTDGASLVLDGANLGGVAVSSISGVGLDPVTFGGIGTIGSVGTVGTPFDGTLRLGDLGASATSVLNVTGDVQLASSSTLESHLLSSSGGTATADLLSVGGAFVAGSSTASIVFDPDVFTGTLVPAAGQTDTYTIVDATGGLSGTFATVNVVTIDPVTGLSTTRTLDQSGETRFFGAGFSVDYGANSFALSVLGIGGPAPLPPAGTTDTNVVVPVQVGATTVDRNANIGIVQNSRINSSVDAMNALLLDPSASADSQFVASQLLLQTDAASYASAVAAVSAPANPNALPTTLMLGMFDAGDVSMRRLMQLRPPGGRQASPGALATQDRRQRPWERGTTSTAAAPQVAVPRRQAFGPEIYGPTPDEGIRGWGRGFGWTGSFSNQSWAQTSYDAVIGSAIAGADVSLGGGGILGAFVGYMPGSVDITGGLVDESMTLNGVDFGVYGSWSPGSGNWYLAGSAAGTWASIDRTRTLYVPGAVRTADSSSTAWAASLMGETGWNLWLGGDSYLDPYVRAGFGYFNQGSYTETGAGSMNLAVGDQQAYALQPSVGARFMHGIRSGSAVITPYVGGAFTAIVPVGDWDVTATNAFSTLPSMGVYGSPDTQYGGSMEAGLEWALPSGFTFFAAFNGMFLTDVQVYGGSAGIVIPF
jgi:hypothetical protein